MELHRHFFGLVAALLLAGSSLVRGCPPGGGPPLPPGPWSHNYCKKYDSWCDNAPLLSTWCRGPDKSFNRFNIINASLCVGDGQIEIANGVLVCKTYSPLLPRGTWTGSCTPVSMVGSQLTARCMACMECGPDMVNTFDVSRCPGGSLENNNGKLQCDGAVRVEFGVHQLDGGGHGSFVIELFPRWAPLGAQRFKDIVTAGIWRSSRFFRVIPNGLVQWGIPANPNVTAEWISKKINDDPAGVQSNAKGTVAFATDGANSRTEQVFINLRDNLSLDSQGFTPVGKIISGMDVVERIFSGYGETPDQALIESQGNVYLEKSFPQLSFISTAKYL